MTLRQEPTTQLKSRGFALISVLWGLALLSLIAASFAAGARSDVNLAYNHKTAAQADALAEAAITRAVAGLYLSPEDGGLRGDGSAYQWAYGGGQLRIQVWDEGGKVDLNASDQTLIAALLEELELGPDESRELAAAIVDFHDADDLTLVSGAEDDDYRLAGLAHGAKDAPFETVSELQQVIGMSTALYHRLAPLVTVYSGTADPDEDLAPPAIRRALGFEAQPTVRDVGATTSQDPDDGALSPTLYRQGPSESRSGSGVFHIHAEAETADGSVAALDAVLRLSPNTLPPYRVLSWQRGERRLFAVTASANAAGQEVEP